MSDIIRLLPDSVANQIAAGEVIQRPASVLKELVENSVDAGATDIRIFVKDAGRTLLQVIDNGRGMTETDARMAFERHATSKIAAASDLFTLQTMGFRGEALPSICAISEVEITTRTDEDSVGTRLVIRGSKVESQEPAVCERGTNIAVHDLFFNVPARRKFLKSDSVELSNLMREFERLALVNNDVRMSIDTGNRRIDLRAVPLKQRIHDIWKNNLNMQLVPVKVETSLIRIDGFVSRPEFARRRNPLQFLIVNGRNMRHPYFHKAVLSCYEGLIATDTQPCYFLKFEVDPGSIDVNIHPTKNEIKFEYEQQIWPILVAAVKAALGKHAAVPSIDFDSEVVPVVPLQEGETPVTPDLGLPGEYNPFTDAAMAGGTSTRSFGNEADFVRGSESRTQGGVKSSFRATRVDRGWENLYLDFMHRTDDALHQEQAAAAKSEVLPLDEGSDGKGDFIPAPMCLQYGLKYIVTPTRDGLVIIDQHRAHVKVLYESCLRSVNHNASLSQRVMFAETITLDPEHQAALSEVSDQLHRLGFQLEYEEEDRWRIEAIPAMMPAGGDAADVVMRLLDSVCEESAGYGSDGAPAESLLKRAALLLARSSALTGGRRLTGEEMEHLVGELFALPDPATTPDGHAVYCRLDTQAIASLLG